MRLRTSWPASLARPSRKPSSIRKAKAATVAPEPCDQLGHRLRRAARGDHVVDDEHALARAGARPRGSRGCRCRTRARRSPCSVVAGQLARLAHRDEARPSRSARTPPRMKPRLSIATTLSDREVPAHLRHEVERRRGRAPASRSRVVMSLKTMPGFGKSGTSRMAAFRASTSRGSVSWPMAPVESGL